MGKNRSLVNHLDEFLQRDRRAYSVAPWKLLDCTFGRHEFLKSFQGVNW